MKLPNSVVAAVSRELRAHYSNSELQDLFVNLGLIPVHQLSVDNSHTRRGRPILLEEINDWAPDPLAALGKVLATYMDLEVPNPHTEVGMMWLTGRDRILGELESCGLDYVSGGTVLKADSAKQIEVLRSYFMVWYEDSLRLNLYPEPLVFIGKNLNSEEHRGSDLWYFQDLYSYSEFGAYNSMLTRPERSPAGVLTCLQYDDLYQIVDYMGLAKRLLVSTERRLRYKPLPPSSRFCKDLLYYRIRYLDSAQLRLNIQSLKFKELSHQSANTEGVFRFHEIRSHHEDSYECEAEVGACFDLEDGQEVEVQHDDAASVLDCPGLAAELERCAVRQAEFELR